jgi:hypothetical protein
VVCQGVVSSWPATSARQPWTRVVAGAYRKQRPSASMGGRGERWRGAPRSSPCREWPPTRLERAAGTDRAGERGCRGEMGMATPGGRRRARIRPKPDPGRTAPASASSSGWKGAGSSFGGPRRRPEPNERRARAAKAPRSRTCSPRSLRDIHRDQCVPLVVGLVVRRLTALCHRAAPAVQASSYIATCAFS